jgi:hypothetical protein
MRESFASDAEVEALVEGFESASLLPCEFSHHAHMAVALTYVSRMPEEIALGRMRACVQKFAAAHGKSQLYHETLTVFWMRLLSHLSRIYRVDLPLWTRINLIIERWGTRLPVEAHYSPELIRSDAARSRWMPPDRLPLSF